LTGLSFYLSEARRKAEAVATGEEGIQILRALYNKRADIFGDGLAGSLHNYSIVLALASQKDKALKAAAEAVDLRRQATVMPERRLDLLALALYTYALRAAALEQWDDCLEAGKESLTHYRALNALRPRLFDSEIIRGLQTYSKHLQKQKRSTEALAARREHVEAVRSSFKREPKRHRPGLARALHYLGVYAAALGLWEEAIQADEESLSHYQILAEEDEEKYSDDVIHSYRMLSHHLFKYKQPDKAIHNKEQQIVGLRKAFAKDRDSRRADLALALYNLAVDLASNNRWDEAVVADKEALEHYRVLTKSDPKRYGGDLTDTLFNYGNHAGKADRMEESLMAHRRHVAIMRQRFGRMPETNRLDFAEGLYNLSYQAATMELWKEALNADKQSLRLYRELSKHNPKKYASDLVDALSESADHLSSAGQHQQALEFRQEQVGCLLLKKHLLSSSNRSFSFTAIAYFAPTSRYQQPQEVSIGFSLCTVGTWRGSQQPQEMGRSNRGR
jgi:tetratricopeptide (TPR) repeat protein